MSTSLAIRTEDPLSNPVDLAEQVVMDRDWAFDRPTDEELVAEVSSQWCNYRMWFAWDAEMGGFMFSCSLEAKLPKNMRTRLYPLLAMVNERLWLGHFDLLTEDSSVAFRHALLLRDGNTVSAEQIEDLMDIAIKECDRFYPAFQALVWSGKTAEESLEVAIFDTVGEA